MGDQKRAQPQHEIKSRFAASTDAADAIHVEDSQGKAAAHAASSHQRKPAPSAAPKAPDAAELKDSAQQESMQLIDLELLDLARELYKSEPNLYAASQQITAARSDASRDDMELDRDKRTEAEEVAANLEGADDKKKHVRTQQHLREDGREKSADTKMGMSIQQADMTSLLTPAVGQLQAIIAKASTHGLHASGLERSTSYLRGVLERFGTICIWSGIEVPVLTQLRSELTKFTNHANIAAAKDVQIEKLGRVDDEHAHHDTAFLAVGAAQAQADLAKTTSDPHELANAVALIESHLGDAIHVAHQLRPDSRHTLKGQAQSLVADTKAVDQAAVTHHLNTPSLGALTATLLHELSK